MNSKFDYEFIVVGGGSAGHAAASKAAKLGLHCALVENAPDLGGLCILRGCMPSKALIETANRMRIVCDAARFGIRTSEPGLDLQALRERVGSLVRDFQSSRVDDMHDSGYRLIRADVRFLTKNEIEITETSGTKSTLKAATFLIATGSAPIIPEIPGLTDTPYWTSDDLPRLPYLPKRLVILGAGAIGMECAHLFEGLGSDVTVIARGSHMLAGHDPDLSAGMEAESLERGIHFLKNTSLSGVRHSSSGFLITLEGQEKTLSADALLIATGRTPRTKGLGLETIGVARDEDRILTDERATTSLSHIFAAGDCTNTVAVVHLAVMQGEVAALNAHRLLHKDHTGSPAEWNRESIMAAWFTEPQAVEIGLGVNDAKEKNIPILIGKTLYSDHGKGMIGGSKHGFLKVIASAEDGRLLGAVGLGPEVAETGHLLEFAIEQGLTSKEYLALPHYHPTYAEAWSRAVESLK